MEQDEWLEDDLLDYNVAMPGIYDDIENNLKIELMGKAKDISECIVINVTGCIDTYNHKFFQKQITLAIANGFSKVILD